YSRIIGTGSYLPSKILTNHDLEKTVDTNDQWIQDRTGIKKRHIVADNETTTDLAFNAATKAIEAAGISHDDVDLIIVATTTPSRIFPSTASLVQERLGISGCPAFDIQAVCTGFVYALAVADKFIKSGSVKNALVIGAESLSRIVDWTDRNTCVLFGDGAGAVVLSASDETGILSTHIHSDGKFNALLSVPTGPGAVVNDQAKPFIEMGATKCSMVAVKTLRRIADETLAANNLQKK
ncbi:UNVERIFIED_CONTAM: hypothetical protein GTU68_004881, partial [Idotea baltica]|nr:hypothetical protein [Idotea baltica]